MTLLLGVLQKQVAQRREAASGRLQLLEGAKSELLDAAA